MLRMEPRGRHNHSWVHLMADSESSADLASKLLQLWLAGTSLRDGVITPKDCYSWYGRTAMRDVGGVFFD